MIKELKAEEKFFYRYSSFSEIINEKFQPKLTEKIFVNEENFLHNDVNASMFENNGFNFWHWNGIWIR